MNKELRMDRDRERVNTEHVYNRGEVNTEHRFKQGENEHRKQV